jgi:hypothetical protein
MSRRILIVALILAFTTNTMLTGCSLGSLGGLLGGTGGLGAIGGLGALSGPGIIIPIVVALGLGAVVIGGNVLSGLGSLLSTQGQSNGGSA